MGYAYAHDGEAVFTDVAATANNRVYTYEITGYDKWLEKTEPGRTKEVKVSHRGDIDRTLWTVSTNLTNSELEEPGEDHPDTYVQPGLEKMVDLETEGAVTTFTGSVKAGQTPEIVLELNQPELVTRARLHGGRGNSHRKIQRQCQPGRKLLGEGPGERRYIYPGRRQPDRVLP